MDKQTVINEFIEQYTITSGNPPQNLIASLGIIFDIVEDLVKRSVINVANISDITASFDIASGKHLSISSYYSNNGFRRKFVEFLANKYSHNTDSDLLRENRILKRRIEECQEYKAIAEGRAKAEQDRIEFQTRAERAESILIRWFSDGQITMDTEVEEIIRRSGRDGELLSSDHMDMVRISNLGNINRFRN